MAWWLAPAIRRLFQDANRLAPARSRAADGTIGDAAHRARTSDHNPDPDESVDAGDLTHDPEHGCDIGVLWERIRTARDRRVRYAIFAGRWFWGWSGTARGFTPWRWYPFHGDNRHDRHGHLSVEDAYQNDAGAWWPAAEGDDVTAEELVGAVQEGLRRYGLEPDGSSALSRIDANTDAITDIQLTLEDVAARLTAIEAKLTR